MHRVDVFSIEKLDIKYIFSWNFRMKSAFVVSRAPVPSLHVVSHQPSAHLHTRSSAAPSSVFLSSLWLHSLSSFCIYSVLTWCPLHTHLAPTLTPSYPSEPTRHPLGTRSTPTPHPLRTRSTRTPYPLHTHSTSTPHPLHTHSASTPHPLWDHPLAPRICSTSTGHTPVTRLLHWDSGGDNLLISYQEEWIKI